MAFDALHGMRASNTWMCSARLPERGKRWSAPALRREGQIKGTALRLFKSLSAHQLLRHVPERSACYALSYVTNSNRKITCCLRVSFLGRYGALP